MFTLQVNIGLSCTATEDGNDGCTEVKRIIVAKELAVVALVEFMLCFAEPDLEYESKAVLVKDVGLVNDDKSRSMAVIMEDE